MDRAEAETILIIDDEESSRTILTNIFQQEYRILTAQDGFEGLKLIQENKNDLCAILLDSIMPEISGLDVLYQLNMAGLTQLIPVFLVTSDSRAAVVREAFQYGVMDVISKPVAPHIVQRRVAAVVELFHTRRRLGAEVERQRDQLIYQTRQLAEMGMGMVEALATAIEFRSDESGEHVRRIHDITCHLLRNTPLGAGLSEETIKLIGVASITHDVGKISIPDSILNKRGRLTPEEFDIMKGHTVKGAELLEKIPQMRTHASYPYAYDIALHHHERWDGRGYPDGLVGEETPIWTQIVSLADVYDALVSKRCYKDALSRERAMNMILGGECGAFNPELLQYFQQAEPRIGLLYQWAKGV